MEQVLKRLLDRLDLISEENAEILDSDVRLQLSDALFNCYIDPIDDYDLPDNFGLFTDEGNQKVRVALKSFVDDAIPLAIQLKLITPDDKLGEFQNDDVESSIGSVYDDYFGYIEVC
ncbi:MAG: hypothetical protein JKY67_19025 [Pseudomonadales bacterium]|nr:hypothetical protein [Pseudomonadales bacterium]